VIRRSLADGKLAFFSTWCPAGTPVETLIAVEGRRWAIEDAFETAKTELGLAHNETRSWHGWHRHVSLVMLAFAMMAVVRHRAEMMTPSQKNAQALRRQRWCAGALVSSGDPASCRPLSPAWQRAGVCHCLVGVSTVPPSCSPQGAPQTRRKIDPLRGATVVLECVAQEGQQNSFASEMALHVNAHT